MGYTFGRWQKSLKSSFIEALLCSAQETKNITEIIPCILHDTVNRIVTICIRDEEIKAGLTRGVRYI